MDDMIRHHELPCDGERFVPEKMGGVIALEHWHRYLFAAQFVTDKDVLDIASGEGYGSARLASVARTVVGVDISSDAVAHARATYELNNLEYLVGKCEAIPLSDHSIDVVVSFETIEHFEGHRAMMAEIKRVLRPGGLLVISSPNKQEYSDTAGYSNPFHLKELYGYEFKEILASNFGNIVIYGQRVLSGSLIEGEVANGGLDYFDIDDLDAPKANYLSDPLYFIALASDGALPKPSVSILEKDFQALYAEISDFRNSGVTNVIHAITRRESGVLREALRSAWYLEQNADLIQAGVDPVAHWFTTGFAEGRIPSSDLTQLVKEILEERLQAAKAEVGFLLEEIERMRSEQPVDLRNLEAEMERTRLRARYEIDAMVRQMLQREEASSAQILHLHREAEALQAEKRLAAQQELDVLSQRHAEREEQLRTEITRRESELTCLQREALERQRAQESELAEVRHQAQKEIEALLHKLAEREQAFGVQLVQLHEETDARQTEQRLVAQQELDVLSQRHAEREEQLRTEITRRESELTCLQREALERQRAQESELAEVRHQAQKEIEALLHKLAEREQAFGAQLVQLHEEADARQTEQRLVAQQELDVLSQRHAEREEQLRTEITRRESELTCLQREALERQRVQEAEIAQARQEVREGVEKLTEREQAFSAQIIQLHREAEAQLTAQRQALQRDLEALTQRHTDREKQLCAEFEQKYVELNSIQQESEIARQKLKTELDVICATRSWRWTAPLRSLFDW